MVHTAPATGNPLNGTNYWQSWKWGKINGTPNKWTDGGKATEKGRLYEGEKISSNCISFINEVPYI